MFSKKCGKFKEKTFQMKTRNLVGIAKNISLKKNLVGIRKDISLKRNFCNFGKDISLKRNFLNVGKGNSLKKNMFGIAKKNLGLSPKISRNYLQLLTYSSKIYSKQGIYTLLDTWEDLDLRPRSSFETPLDITLSYLSNINHYLQDDWDTDLHQKYQKQLHSELQTISIENLSSIQLLALLDLIKVSIFLKIQKVGVSGQISNKISKPPYNRAHRARLRSQVRNKG